MAMPPTIFFHPRKTCQMMYCCGKTSQPFHNYSYHSHYNTTNPIKPITYPPPPLHPNGRELPKRSKWVSSQLKYKSITFCKSHVKASGHGIFCHVNTPYFMSRNKAFFLLSLLSYKFSICVMKVAKWITTVAAKTPSWVMNTSPPSNKKLLLASLKFKAAFTYCLSFQNHVN